MIEITTLGEPEMVEYLPRLRYKKAAAGWNAAPRLQQAVFVHRGDGTRREEWRDVPTVPTIETGVTG